MKSIMPLIFNTNLSSLQNIIQFNSNISLVNYISNKNTINFKINEFFKSKSKNFALINTIISIIDNVKNQNKIEKMLGFISQKKKNVNVWKLDFLGSKLHVENVVKS